MQVIELMEVWRGERYTDSVTAMSSDEFPEIVALLPDSELRAGDRIKPLIAENVPENAL
ncbi:MAG: hypothetical protein HFG27_02470 [Provencibacterium sp.]|jgi:hypothetical protein|nr:hypothetical protein [Provencibacterium sp.]